jgi:hypothetical protein
MLPKQGLLRHLPIEHAGDVIVELKVLYTDVFDALEATHANVAELKLCIDDLLYGEDRDSDIDD